MYYTVIKHDGHLRTLDKCRKHSPAARVFYISLVFSNDHRVLSQCNTRLLPSRQVNMAGSCEWIFRLFGRHHCKSRIFERMELFQNDCCRPWTKKPFKNSCSRQLRIVSAVVSWSPAGRIDRRNLFFSKMKLLFLKRWWQLRMKSTEIKQRYRIKLFSVMFRLSVLLLNSMSKLIHNRCTCKLIIKTPRLRRCMQKNNCVFVFLF